MKNTLNVAQRQLYARPDDECFPGWDPLLGYLRSREFHSGERDIHHASLSVVPAEDTLMLSNGFEDYHLNDWSFRQVCDLSSAPPNFINRLPADLAADVLNRTRQLYGTEKDEGRLLIQGAADPVARALYSRTYTRIPDLTVAELVRRTATGFVPAGDVAGRHVGMPPVRPERSGLYASSRDMFLFLADEDNPVEWRPDNGGQGAAFYRFLIVANSETTARKLCYLMGLMEGICGNHLIWGAEEVLAIERRHVGDADKILEELEGAIEALRDRRTLHEDLRILQVAKTTTFAADQEKAVEILYPKYVTKQIAAQAVESAIADFHASLPLSVWNVVRGLTRVSQHIPYEDERVAVDRTAGKLLAAVKD